ncbi:MarR family winged helix-turn-helix transcriptional regulator [Sphaerimonospora mesophila]|uniref:MarR family winged helix-turn-helix transcriptional regulator n=1 Tax=Sphaerimonospora mesophila TaxID=37483 RepID=UPI000A75391B
MGTVTTDHVDFVLEQWQKQRPDLDMSAMEVIGRLPRLMRFFTAALRRTFGAHGLDPASFDVLATLYRSEPRSLSPADLMRASMVTSGAVTQRLDRLESRGLVTRTPSASDGRCVRVALTEEGVALMERVLPYHVETENRLLVALDPADRETLADTLRDLLISLGDLPD